MAENRALADGIIVVLKPPGKVERRDASNGRFIGMLPISDAAKASTDGTTIAILRDNGSIVRYSAKEGRFLGTLPFSAKNIDSLQVSSGVIVIQQNRKITRYDAPTGGFLGTTSL